MIMKMPPPRQKRPGKSVDLAEPNIVDIQPLVNYRALLEEDLPGSDCGADIGHQDKDQIGSKPGGKFRTIKSLWPPPSNPALWESASPRWPPGI